MAQLTNHIMMIRPSHFGYNEQTAKDNFFQSGDTGLAPKEIAHAAQKEFDSMVDTLTKVGVDIIVIQDTENPVKPDAVFPNNWISFHSGGIVITYPMFAPNRRIERRDDVIEIIGQHFDVNRRYTFDHYEKNGLFLEGTGSMIFDREHKIVYACLSQRTDVTLIDKFCVLMGYRKVLFNAMDNEGKPIYHTNVMMALGRDFVIICKECIDKEENWEELKNAFENTRKEIIEITLDQVEKFAGNMLQVKTDDGVPVLVMSKSAFDSLDKNQITILENHTKILTIPIPTIEHFGGGSVRCMMAEIFLPQKKDQGEK